MELGAYIFAHKQKGLSAIERGDLFHRLVPDKAKRKEVYDFVTAMCLRKIKEVMEGE